MRGGALFAAALLSAACNTNLLVNPEGYLCDEGNVCPEGFVCAGGVCRDQAHCPNGACACEGVTCPAPQAPECLDGSTLRTFAAGVCNPSDGTCRFAPTDTVCLQGCVKGACSTGACPANPCTAVPSPSCLDAATLRVFSAACASGVCSYPGSDISCLHGCTAGMCVDQDLCVGVTCNHPPAALCVAGAARTFDPLGVCAVGTGVCSYASHDAPCTLGCAAGACVAPPLLFVQTGPKIRHAVTALDQAPLSSGNLVLAVGPGGAVSRWNGLSWNPLASGTTANLNSVWLASTTSGWVAGENKTLLRFDGTALTPETLSVGPAGANLVAVHGHTDSHVLLADDSGNFWRYDGTTWTSGALPAADGPYVMKAAFVDDADHEHLAGLCGTPGTGCVSFASSASAATVYVDLDDATAEGFRSVGPSVEPLASVFAFAGADASPVVRRYDSWGGTFDVTRAPSTLAGGAVVAISPAAIATGQAVYVMTARKGDVSGQLYRYTSAPALDPGTPLLDFRGVGQAMSRNDSGGVVVADSAAKAATVTRRGTVTNQVMDLGESWQAAGFGAGGSLVLMDLDGDLATRATGGTWSFRRSPAKRMNGLAVGASYSLIVGLDGAAYRFNTSFTPLVTNTAGTLSAVCRVSDSEWYLVGKGGVLRGSDGYSVSTFASPSAQDLLDVACLKSGEALAVGAAGTVLRLAGGSWQQVTPVYPDNVALASVAQGPAGEIYVAGDGVFSKMQGQVWTKLPALPGLTRLQVRGANDVYAIANGNRVVRFDGASWNTIFTSPEPLLAGAASAGKVVFAGSNGALIEGQ